MAALRIFAILVIPAVAKEVWNDEFLESLLKENATLNVTVAPHNAVTKEAFPLAVAAADLSRPRASAFKIQAPVLKAAQKLHTRQSGKYAAEDLAMEDAAEQAARAPKKTRPELVKEILKASHESEEEAPLLRKSAAPVKAMQAVRVKEAAPANASMTVELPKPPADEVEAVPQPAASTNASARAINFLPPGARFDPPSAAAGKGFEQGKAAAEKKAPPFARGGEAAAEALAAKPTVQPAHIFDDDFTKDGHQVYTSAQWESPHTRAFFSGAARTSALGLALLAAAAVLV